MYKITYLAGALALLTACTEVPPAIDFSSVADASDTTFVTATVPAADPKVAYLEEFTGVQCINCVQGHETIAALLAQHGDRLAAVGIHSGDFSDPYNAPPYVSAYDFRTADGDNINSTIYNNIAGQPSAGIDRRKFASESRRETFRSKWAGYVQYQVNTPNPCNVKLEPTYNAATNKLKVRATVTFTQDVTGAVKITLLLSENGITDIQLLPNGTKDTNYKHKHVFRRAITPWDGSLLPNGNARGRVYVRTFEITPDNAWRLDSCEIVGIVHQAADSLKVFQAVKVKAK
jgi:hypothetical protein